VFTNNEKYQLWFEYFNAFDRVKLWNKLVFSENYFNFVAQNYSYSRSDIKYYLSRI